MLKLVDLGIEIGFSRKYTLFSLDPTWRVPNVYGKQYNKNANISIIINVFMCNQCCCYSKPILDVADNKFAESAAVLMLNAETGFIDFREYCPFK